MEYTSRSWKQKRTVSSDATTSVSARQHISILHQNQNVLSADQQEASGYSRHLNWSWTQVPLFHEGKQEAIQEQESIQRTSASLPQQEYQQSAAMQMPENTTGLPDHLKANIENYSGYSLDDVQVHYNSSRPADVLALAYTQGSDIYVGPGQEQHLPHEAWHVVQQKQGRVRPSLRIGGMPVNNDPLLEHEADSIGAGVTSGQLVSTDQQHRASDVAQSVQMVEAGKSGAVQRYTELKGDYFLSESGEIIVLSGTKEFYSTKHRIDQANNQLKAKGSFIRLFATNEKCPVPDHDALVGVFPQWVSEKEVASKDLGKHNDARSYTDNVVKNTATLQVDKQREAEQAAKKEAELKQRKENVAAQKKQNAENKSIKQRQMEEDKLAKKENRKPKVFKAQQFTPAKVPVIIPPVPLPKPFFATWADCSKAAQAVIGSKMAHFEDTQLEVGQTLEKIGKRGDQLSDSPGLIGQLYGDIFYTRAIPSFLQNVLADQKKDKLIQNVHYTSDTGKSEIIKSNNPKECRMQYDALPADLKDEFDQVMGINKYASPDVGEAYIIVSEKQMPGWKPSQKMEPVTKFVERDDQGYLDPIYKDKDGNLFDDPGPGRKPMLQEAYVKSVDKQGRVIYETEIDASGALQYNLDQYGGLIPTYELDEQGNKIPEMVQEWVYHWGGVVMADGKDRVTLEGFSVGVANTVSSDDWTFNLLGTEGSGITFQEQHADVARQHGTRSTTMVIKTR